MNQHLLTIVIKDKQKLQFDGTGASVTSVNSEGVFDILSQHANFITLIKDFVIVDRSMPSEKEYKIEKGIMYVMENKVTVYVGI